MDAYKFVFEHFNARALFEQEYLDSLWQRCQVNEQVQGNVAVNFFKLSNLQLVSADVAYSCSNNSKKYGI
jgi:hypothetical protein